MNNFLQKCLSKCSNRCFSICTPGTVRFNKKLHTMYAFFIIIAATKWNCLNIWPFDWKVKDGATFLGLNDLADLLAPVLEKLPKPDASSAPKPKRARKILEEATVPMILRDQLGDTTPVTAQPQKQTPATRRTTTSSSPFVNNRTHTAPKSANQSSNRKQIVHRLWPCKTG